jgi:hypothetical protein
VPEKEIDSKERYYRIFSLIGVLNGALKVRSKFKESSSELFRQALSDHAYNFLTNDLYQQDVNSELEKMKNNNDDYNSGLNFIYDLFNSSTDSQS